MIETEPYEVGVCARGRSQDLDAVPNGEIDALLRNASRGTALEGRRLPAAPARKLAVLTCMDARMDPCRILGLSEGDAHVIRNAGGVVSDDAIRSLAISQMEMGTQEILLMHHTNCGMLAITEHEFKAQLEEEVGARPAWPIHAMTDLRFSLRAQAKRLRDSRFILCKGVIRGVIYDVHDGTLTEINVGG